MPERRGDLSTGMDILLQRTYFDVVEKDCGQYDTVTEVMWVTGAALLSGWLIIVKLEVGWSFFAHMEEIDLCWRLRSRGKSLSVFRKVWYIM